MKLLPGQKHAWPPIVLIGSVALFAVLPGCDATGSAEEERAETESRAVPVRAVPVRSETLRETVRGVGTLQAAETVEIRPEMSGRVSKINFEEGASVEEGAPLYTLDARKLNQQLASREASQAAAEARLTNARIQYEQTQKLRDQNVASREELERARADFEAARAEVEGAKADLGEVRERLADARLRAPFRGMISESRVDPGAYVEAGDLLTTMYRTNEMEIAFRLPERVMGRVRRGQSVEVMVAAYPEREFDSEVYFVSPEVNESTRNFLVKATVDNSEGLLRPGAFGTAVVTVDVRPEQPVIPEESLIATREGYSVFIVVDGVARQRRVQVGLRTAGEAGIREGLEVGETVVRQGHMNLSDGDRVRIANQERPSDPSEGGGLADQDQTPGAQRRNPERETAPAPPKEPGNRSTDSSRLDTPQPRPAPSKGTP